MNKEGSRAAGVTERDTFRSAPGPCPSSQGRERAQPSLAWGPLLDKAGTWLEDSFRQERGLEISRLGGCAGLQGD